MLAYIAEFDTLEPDLASELEGWSVGEPLTAMIVEQRAAILQRADVARNIYARMLDQQ
jgi:hypothetical protein